MSEHDNDAAEQAARKANMERTLAMLQKPGREEQREQDARALAEANHHAMAVQQWPETRILLAKLNPCDEGIEAGPPVSQVTQVLEAIALIFTDFGPAAFDQPVADLSHILGNAANDALHNYPNNLLVALAAGALIKALADRMQLKNKSLVFEECKSALRMHGVDVRVQKMYRNVLMGFGYCRLDQPTLVLMKNELARASTLMALWGRAEIAPQEVLQCLTLLDAHAHFVLMSDSEQVLYKDPVVLFAVWCLERSMHHMHNALFFGDLHVARMACALLHKVATGCMQLDDQHLIEKDRLYLRLYNLPKIMFQLQNHILTKGGSSDDARIQWLFERLNRNPIKHMRYQKGPADEDAPDGKRSRAAGGSA
jgi:hypothetical protein